MKAWYETSDHAPMRRERSEAQEVEVVAVVDMASVYERENGGIRDGDALEWRCLGMESRCEN